MDFLSNLKIAANKLIFGKSKTYDAYDLANLVNRSYNYLWKIADINSEHPIPIEIIVPIIKAKKDYTILDIICWECGGILVKLPKTLSSKNDHETITSFQLVTAEAVESLTKAIHEPTEENLKKCLEKLKDCTKESISAHKYAEKKLKKQMELEL